MDKVKQNIIQQQQLDKFNIEKSVVGTEAYYINQDIQKGMSGDEIIEKARSGVYKLTAENKKAGRVGQRYGSESKSNLKQDSGGKLYETVKFSNGIEEQHYSDKLHKLNFIADKNGLDLDNYKDFQRAEEILKEKSNSKESTDKKESKPEKDYVLARDLKEGKEYTWGMGAEYMKCQYVGEGEKPYTYKFKLGNSTHNLSMKDVKDYIKPLSFLND